MSKLTLNELKKFVKENSRCKLLSTEYIMAHDKMKFQCECGEEFDISFSKFKFGKRQCSKCSKRIAWNFQSVKKWVLENSESKLLSTEYINARTSLQFRCKCGKEFERTFDNLQRKKTTLCKSCAGIKLMSNLAKEKLSKSSMKPIEDVINLVKNQMKCKFIKRYVKEGTRSTVIVFECSEHGVQEAYYTNLAKRKGCPLCNEHNKQNSKGMIKIETWLSKNNVKFVKEKRFTNCKDKKKLPFDYYLTNRNICIEFDGRQHFEKAYFGGFDETKAQLDLDYTRRHDKIKTNYCLNNNIKLIRISYLKENYIDEILESVLP